MAAVAPTLGPRMDEAPKAAVSADDAAKRALVVQTAQSAFMFADMDGSGTIDFSEMSKMMERMLDDVD